LDVDSFDNRIRLQKLIYILKNYNVKFPYNFTWWKYGPDSPQLADDMFKSDRTISDANTRPYESQILGKIKDAKAILSDSRKAELIASFLYLKKSMATKNNDEVVNELLSKKPYFTKNEVSETMRQWDRIERHFSSDK
jgi:uncharacterized protein YwgA